MKKYAAIDIGTNSMRLLLAEVANGQILSREKYMQVTRIGGSVDRYRKISEEGMVRNINALGKFARKAREYGADKILAMATSAVRDASNGEEFVKRAYQETGVDIKIISGEEEASLGYKGVAIGLNQIDSSHELGNLSKAGQGDKFLKEASTYGSKELDRNLVIDIGGGSTELILGQGPKLKEAISLNIGAVRMTERYITTDPVTREEYEKLSKGVSEAVGETIGTVFPDLLSNEESCFSTSWDISSTSSTHRDQKKEKTKYKLIGIGGTITTLAALEQELEPYNPDKVHNYKLSLNQISQLKEKLSSLRVEEIRQLKGIQAKRADIILAGLTILSIIMEDLNLNEITVSEYDNLEGLVFKAID